MEKDRKFFSFSETACRHGDHSRTACTDFDTGTDLNALHFRISVPDIIDHRLSQTEFRNALPEQIRQTTGSTNTLFADSYWECVAVFPYFRTFSELFKTQTGSKNPELFGIKITRCRVTFHTLFSIDFRLICKTHHHWYRRSTNQKSRNYSVPAFLIHFT